MNAETWKSLNRVAEAGAFLHQMGWVPATSGNFSLRTEAGRVLLTASGLHKGKLTPDDFLEVDMQGVSLEIGRKPSAETLLHVAIYQQFPQANCILHTHSVNATVLSRLLAGSERLVLEGYELQKAFAGVETHASRLEIPIFDNTQDIPVLIEALTLCFKRSERFPGFLIRGHGLYTWGRTPEETERHIEAFEFLFKCELEMRRCAP